MSLENDIGNAATFSVALVDPPPGSMDSTATGALPPSPATGALEKIKSKNPSIHPNVVSQELYPFHPDTLIIEFDVNRYQNMIDRFQIMEDNEMLEEIANVALENAQLKIDEGIAALLQTKNDWDWDNQTHATIFTNEAQKFFQSAELNMYATILTQLKELVQKKVLNIYNDLDNKITSHCETHKHLHSVNTPPQAGVTFSNNNYLHFSFFFLPNLNCHRVWKFIVTFVKGNWAPLKIKMILWMRYSWMILHSKLLNYMIPNYQPSLKNSNCHQKSQLSKVLQASYLYQICVRSKSINRWTKKFQKFSDCLPPLTNSLIVQSLRTRLFKSKRSTSNQAMSHPTKMWLSSQLLNLATTPPNWYLPSKDPTPVWLSRCTTCFYRLPIKCANLHIMWKKPSNNYKVPQLHMIPKSLICLPRCPTTPTIWVPLCSMSLVEPPTTEKSGFFTNYLRIPEKVYPNIMLRNKCVSKMNIPPRRMMSLSQVFGYLILSNGVKKNIEMKFWLKNPLSLPLPKTSPVFSPQRSHTPVILPTLSPTIARCITKPEINVEMFVYKPTEISTTETERILTVTGNLGNLMNHARENWWLNSKKKLGEMAQSWMHWLPILSAKTVITLPIIKEKTRMGSVEAIATPPSHAVTPENSSSLSKSSNSIVNTPSLTNAPCSNITCKIIEPTNVPLSSVSTTQIHSKLKYLSNTFLHPSLNKNYFPTCYKSPNNTFPTPTRINPEGIRNRKLRTMGVQISPPLPFDKNRRAFQNSRNTKQLVQLITSSLQNSLETSFPLPPNSGHGGKWTAFSHEITTNHETKICESFSNTERNRHSSPTQSENRVFNKRSSSFTNGLDRPTRGQHVMAPVIHPPPNIQRSTDCTFQHPNRIESSYRGGKIQDGDNQTPTSLIKRVSLGSIIRSPRRLFNPTPPPRFQATQSFQIGRISAGKRHSNIRNVSRAIRVHKINKGAHSPTQTPGNNSTNLHRRCYSLGQDSTGMQSQFEYCDPVVSEPRLVHQVGEDHRSSNSVPFSGMVAGHTKDDHFRTITQSPKNSPDIVRIPEKDNSDTEGNISDLGTSYFHKSGYSLYSAAHTKINHTTKLDLETIPPRQSQLPTQNRPTGGYSFGPFRIKRQFAELESFGNNPIFSKSDLPHRCMQVGLGGQHSVSECDASHPKNVGLGTTETGCHSGMSHSPENNRSKRQRSDSLHSHLHSGVKGGRGDTPDDGIHVSPTGNAQQEDFNYDRQHLHNGTHKQTRGKPMQISNIISCQDSSLVQSSQHYSDSRSHSWETECNSRLRLSSRDTIIPRMAVEKVNFQPHMLNMATIYRPVCRSNQLSISSLCVAAPRSPGPNTRCLFIPMVEHPISLDTPSMGTNRSNSSQNFQRSSRSINTHPHMAIGNLVSSTTHHELRPTIENLPIPPSTVQCLPARSTPHADTTSYLENIRETYVHTGVSDNTIKILLAGHRQSTHANHQTHFKAWRSASWCLARNHNPLSPTIPLIIDFLGFLFMEDVVPRQASTVAKYTDFFKTLFPGNPLMAHLSDNPLMALFKKGMFELSPTTIRQDTFDPRIILNYINNIWGMTPDTELPLTKLQTKLDFLIRLGSSGRGSDVFHVNYPSLKIIHNAFLSGTTSYTKTTGKSTSKTSPFLACAVYMEGYTHINLIDTFKIFQMRTEPLRTSTLHQNALFLSPLRPPHLPCSTDTLRNYLKELLFKPCQLSDFGPHQLCDASYTAKILSGMNPSMAKLYRWATHSSVPDRFYLHNLQAVRQPESPCPPLKFADYALLQLSTISPSQEAPGPSTNAG